MPHAPRLALISASMLPRPAPPAPNLRPAPSAGGDLKLQSIPGYGTDAYLTLVKLEEQEWQEPLDDPKCTPIQTWAQ